MSSPMPNPLHELADEFGIDTGFRDWQGVQRVVSDDTLRAVLAAFGIDASTPQACVDSLVEDRRRRAQRLLPPCVVVRAGQVASVAYRDSPSGVRLELEDGEVRELPALASIALPADLPTGYHRLVVDDAQTTVIVTPDRLRLPSRLSDPGWGLAVQLYSVHSSRSWGLGDLGDLAWLVEWSAAEHGADFVLVNPLHAAEVVPPMNPSPYLPTSRRFGNPIYLRVEDIAEYDRLDQGDRAVVDRLRVGTLGEEESSAASIDRDQVWAAKLAALELIFAAGRDDARRLDFEAFRAAGGDELERFAAWCALCEMHGPDWHTWPPAVRDPSQAIDAAPAGRRAFWCWLQWVLDTQLGDAQHRATGAGMRLGVVHDVAVGVSPSGADSWSWQHVLAGGVTVGAPPDAYSQRGQDWQQPPWRPDRLAELAYAPLRELFRNALAHAGGLRVDHIIGLFRLWWIPGGMDAAAGTYVHYDHEALIGILVLEAERADAVIIGEDLGNVEPSVRDVLRTRGLLGTSILWFETDEGVPKPPDQWREYCLASVTTHDLPPTLGYLDGEHIRIRDRLGLLTRPASDEFAEALAARHAWIAELTRVGLVADAEPTDEELLVALHRFLTLTPARLRCVALTDAVGERRTQNQPGTLDQYPNWRVPLTGPDGRPVPLDTLPGNRRAAQIIDAVSDR